MARNATASLALQLVAETKVLVGNINELLHSGT